MVDTILLSWLGSIPNILLGIIFGLGFGLVVSRIKKFTIFNISFALLVFGVVTYILTNSYLKVAQLSFFEAFGQITTSQFASDAIASFMLGLGAVIGFLACVTYLQVKQKTQSNNLNVPS